MQPTARAYDQAADEAGIDLDIGAVDDLAPRTLDDFEPTDRLGFIASLGDDLTPYMSETQLASIGAQCCEDYHQDETAREDWRKQAEHALKRARQEKEEARKWPWPGASNASFPLLTTAALQFAARAYPAIVKGDEAVSCKVVGSDRGMPVMGPDGHPVMQVNGMPLTVGPDGQTPVLMTPQGAMAVPPDAQPEPVWQRAPGMKTKRAQRVREFMNYTLFYRMKGWEEDTDTLLHHLPIVGCGFRKVYVSNGQSSDYVPALKLVAPMSAKSCEEAPRMTEIREGQPLNEIIALQRRGFYRDVKLVEDEERTGLRTLLEQHCLLDLDEDGYAEPYVVTLDEGTRQVLRVEADFGVQDVSMAEDGTVMSIVRDCHYVKYDFFPNLDGGFYGLGLGHLLDNITTIVNNTINQMIDAGTAAAAGGGFIGSGVDLSGGGKRNARIMFAPGVYQTVNVSGAKMREAIYERTFPGPNPVTFQVLDLMLGAARDISSIKDVLTGEAKNTGQVGTTMALIEQGLQMFTAIYKRIYRSLKAEFDKLYRNIGLYGGEQAAADYLNILDDPAANFQADFDAQDFDIRPVSDPTNVTKLQKVARAQFLGGFLGVPGVNPQAIIKRMWEAADIEDIDELFAPPQQPDPMAIQAAQAKIGRDMAAGEKDAASAEHIRARIALDTAEEERLRLVEIGKQFREGFQMGMGG